MVCKVGLSILCELAEFGLYREFVRCRDEAPDSGEACIAELTGMLVSPLGGGRWLLDDGARLRVILLPRPEGYRPGQFVTAMQCRVLRHGIHTRLWAGEYRDWKREGQEAQN